MLAPEIGAILHTHFRKLDNYNLPQYCMQNSDYHRQEHPLLVHAQEGSLCAMCSLDSERRDQPAQLFPNIEK